LAPFAVHAATPLEFSGWIPYWREDKGVADAMAHLDQLKEVNPFGYIVQKDGTVMDAMGVADEPWKTLIATAKAKKIRVVPTIMWSDTAAIHTILSKQTSRIALEDEITALAVREGFDGVDIDFEAKRAEDSAYFSTFLKGLYQRMGKKWVMCTIESRTPLSDRYTDDVPADASVYANDFVAINKYCDRVRFMTYDQQNIDQSLATAAAARGEIYAPTADTAWVEKAIKLAAQTIKKSKIVIGIASYGYEWDVTAYADGYTYDLLWSFNPLYATSIAQSLGITPVRAASELTFSYIPTSTPANSAYTVPMSTLVAAAPAGTPSGNQVSAGALALAKSDNSHSTFRYVSWSDATSVKEKVDLARKLGVRGVALFKIDGGSDVWSALK
jgi:spore germination protein YaaH